MLYACDTVRYNRTHKTVTMYYSVHCNNAKCFAVLSAQVPQLGVYLINGSPRVTGGSVEANFQITRPVDGVRCFLRSRFHRIWQNCKLMLLFAVFVKSCLSTGSSGHTIFPIMRPGLYVLKIYAYNRKTDVTFVKREFVVSSDPNYCSLVLVNRGVIVSENGTSAEVEVSVYGPATQLSCALDGGRAFTCKHKAHCMYCFSHTACLLYR